MDIKIGKSTDIDNTLRQYSRGNRDIELLDMWTPNPDKTLSTAERGVHAVAEQYAYDKQSEKFVFLQGAYQEFAETINKLLRNASREDLAEEPASSESDDVDDYTGTTPSVIKILGETHDVDTWADALTVCKPPLTRSKCVPAITFTPVTSVLIWCGCLDDMSPIETKTETRQPCRSANRTPRRQKIRSSRKSPRRRASTS